MGILSFRLGPVPVRVQASFFLMAALIGWQPGPRWGERLAVWTAVVFVGVLLHEMGHALAALAFGYRPRVELYLLGGVTWWEGEGTAERRGAMRTVLITLAGPLTGIAVGLGAWWAAGQWLPPQPPGSGGAYLLERFVWVNVGWGLLNLLPVLPLDGGVVFAALVDMVVGGRGRLVARAVSFLLATGVALLAASAGMFFGTAMAGWLAFDNARAGWSEWQLRRDEAHAGAIERAIEALGRGDAEALAEVAETLQRTAHSLPLRRFGGWLGAWAALLRGERKEVERWVEEHHGGDVRASALLTAAVALKDGKVEAALDLMRAVLSTPLSPLDMAALRAALRAGGRFDVAVALVDSKEGRNLRPEQVAELAEAAAEAGYREVAERLQELASGRVEP